MTKENKKLEELKKEIVIERLRQAPLTLKVSFGNSDGKFMNKDDLIKEVEKGTKTGEKIVEIHLEYLKAFKKGILMQQ